MVQNFFEDKRPDYHRDRKISIFEPHTFPTPKSAEPEINKQVVDAFDEVHDSLELVEGAMKEINKHADMLTVPIGPDDNEVRAAHLRQGGDGRFITFAQFQVAVNEVKRSRADYAFNNELGEFRFSNKRNVERNRIMRALKQYRNKENGIIDENWVQQLEGFGVESLLLYGLNELLGANHAADHEEVTSAKLPPGTEAAGIASQLLRAMTMMIFLHGMTERAVNDYMQLSGKHLKGIDVKSLASQAFKQGPPPSDSFQLLRAGLATSDSELIMHHSVDYAARHIGDGFELWLAYLTTRESHEKLLREDRASYLYRTGQLQGSEARAHGLTKLAASGISAIAQLQSVLGTSLNPEEACCLVRFLLIVDVRFLEAIRSIIQMAIAILESEAVIAFNRTIELMMSPWNVIRSKVIRLADAIIDKIVKYILDAFNADDEVWGIIRACTPISELIQSVLDQIEWIRNWYKQMLDLMGEDIRGWLSTNISSWQTVWGIKKAKEQLQILDRIIQEKEAMISSHTPENRIMALVSEVKGLRKTYNIPFPIIHQIERDMRLLVSEDLPEGDREMLINRIQAKLIAAGVPEEKADIIRAQLFDIAQEKNDTKLNEVLNYAEKAVGEDTVAGKTISNVNYLTREAIEWCRDLGDWDRMKGLFGLSTEESKGSK